MPNENKEDLELLKIDPALLKGEDSGSDDADVSHDMSDDEERAMQDGWRPRNEWEGDPDEWVSAKEFNYRGELMKRISSQTAQLKAQAKKQEDLERAFKVLGEHHKKTAEIERKRIMDALRQEKAEAMRENDFDAVVEIDEKINEIKEEEKADKVATSENAKNDPAANVPKEVVDWLKDPKNAWYHNDPVLKGVANGLSDDYMAQYPEADLIDMLEYVNKRVREEMPHKFNKDTTRTPSKGAVTEARGTPRKSKSKFSSRDLSEEQYKAAKTFVDMGVFENVQAYVDELVNIGELG